MKAFRNINIALIKHKNDNSQKCIMNLAKCAINHKLIAIINCNQTEVGL